MQICEKCITNLLAMNKNKSYESQLMLVLKKLKCCNKIVATNVDEKIVSCIIKLEKSLMYQALSRTTSLNSLHF